MSTATDANTRGDALAHRLQAALRAARRRGSRNLPVVQGLTPKGVYPGGLDNVLAETQEILLASRRVFRYGNSVVMEVRDLNTPTLRTLATDGGAEPCASATLANVFLCEANDSQFPPPRQFVELLVNAEPICAALPNIECYAQRPVFDSEFVYRGPGWHPDANYLIHGPEVEPILCDPPSATVPLPDRLPRRLAALLRDFCFKSQADLANVVAALLTGLLVAHFVHAGKPLILLDGNQAGLGKTLLARVIAIILDAVDADLLHFTTDDEELAKRICATLRARPTSVLVIDNAKIRAGGAINSAVIEANSMAPTLNLRILGHSRNLQRANDLLWFITMNLTKASPDLISRSLPVRFHYEGDPADRDFDGRDPLGFAREHREEILGELAGMVVRWNQLGRPLATRRHRLPQWAQLIGGILEANGVEGFLDNVAEAAAEFNSGLDQLAALAEVAVRDARELVVSEATDGEGGNSRPGAPARRWEPVFRQAGVLVEELLSATSQRSRSVRLGTFLTAHVDRPVDIELDDRRGRAVLRSASGRSNTRSYFFEVEWQAAPEVSVPLKEIGATTQLGDGT